MFRSSRYQNLPNNAYEWNRMQGYRHPTDNHYKTVRNINYRHISISNATEFPIGVLIYNGESGILVEDIKPQFVLQPNQSRDLAVNEHTNLLDQGTQYIRMFVGGTKRDIPLHFVAIRMNL